MKKFNPKRFIFPISVAAVYVLVDSVLKMGWLWAIGAVLLYLAIMVIAYRSDVLAFLAGISYNQGKETEARRLFDIAVGWGTKNPKTLVNYAILLVKENDGHNALKFLALAEKQKMDVMIEKNLMFTYGNVYWAIGDIPKAIESLENMRKKFDYVNSYVLATLGYLYLTQNQLDLAEEISELARAEDAKLNIALDNLGQIYYARGDMAKAKEFFLQAVEVSTNMADPNYFLGLIYENEGDRFNAKKHFERAAKGNITPFNTTTEEQVAAKVAEYSKTVEEIEETDEESEDLA